MSRKIFLPRPEAENISLASSPSPKQRVVAHLGRKDQLAPHLDALIRLLQDETQAPRWVPIQDVSAPRASTGGPIVVARHLFHHLSLGTILDGEPPLRRHGQLAVRTHFPVAGESSHSSWQ